MSKETVTEYTCDECRLSERFLPPYTDEQAKEQGWQISGKKHWCSSECKAKHKGYRYG